MLERVMADYREAVLDTDRNRALAVVQEAVDRGFSPEDIIFNIVLPTIEGMIQSVSTRYETNIAQHFMTSQIAADVTDAMLARFTTAPQVVGQMVIGTSCGDFHGLGKRIVIGCLRARMIGVVDLGLNVPPERFVSEALAHDAQVIGISSMMVHTARGENGCRGVRRILQERGLEQRIKVIVGGAPYRFDPGLHTVVQADAWAENGIAAGRVIAGLIREVRR